MIVRMLKKINSLRISIPLVLFLFISISSLVFYIFYTHLSETQFFNQFQENKTEELSRFQSLVENWILKDRLDVVQSFLLSFGSNIDLKYVLYLNQDGKILAGTKSDWENQSLFQIDPSLEAHKNDIQKLFFQTQTEQKIQSLFLKKEGKAWFCLPISLPLQETSIRVNKDGFLFFFYDLKLPLSESKNVILMNFQIFTLVSILAILGLGLSLNYLIVKRISGLEQAMKDFASQKKIHF